MNVTPTWAQGSRTAQDIENECRDAYEAMLRSRPRIKLNPGQRYRYAWRSVVRYGWRSERDNVAVAIRQMTGAFDEIATAMRAAAGRL